MAKGLDKMLNQTLQNLLLKFVTEMQKHWDAFLNMRTLAYNTLIHTAVIEENGFTFTVHIATQYHRSTMVECN